jgi:predicted glycogen debranching enzyme
VLLSKLEETLFVGGERVELGCNQYPGVIHPRGHDRLIRFRLDPWPVFTYQSGKITLEKSVCLLHGQNIAVVTYVLTAAPGPVGIEIRPLIAGRDIQSLHYDNPAFRTVLETGPDWLAMEPYDKASRFLLQHEPATFVVDGIWYYQFEYAREIERGREGREDLYAPGILVYTLLPGQRFHVVAATGRPGDFDPEALLAEERDWRAARPATAAPVSLVSADKANWTKTVRALGWEI